MAWDRDVTDPTIFHEGRRLTIDSAEIELRYPVQKVIRYDDLVVVLIEPPSGNEVRDNVEAYDLDGNHVWTIEPVTKEETSGSLVYVDVREGDRDLVVRNWNEATYVVDPETGSVEFRGSPWDRGS